jgi:hypothetical protein
MGFKLRRPKISVKSVMKVASKGIKVANALSKNQFVGIAASLVPGGTAVLTGVQQGSSAIAAARKLEKGAGHALAVAKAVEKGASNPAEIASMIAISPVAIQDQSVPTVSKKGGQSKVVERTETPVSSSSSGIFGLGFLGL